MNIQQLGKLKGLIHTSGILNEGERAEWLTLLELMNDKQLNELEKILNSEQRIENREQQKSASSIQHIADSSETKIKEIQKTAQPVRPHMPNLSHIMNLPKTLDGHAPAFKLSQKTMGMPQVAGKELSPLVSSKIIKQKQSFGDRLKAIFAEKELPAGRPENELSLPEQKIEQKDEKKSSAIMADKMVIRGPVKFSSPSGTMGSGIAIGSLPKIKLSDVPEKISPVVPKSAVLSQPPFKKIQDSAPSSSVLKPISKPDFSAIKHASAARLASLSDKEPKHTPGLNIQETPEQIRQDTLTAIKQRMGEASLPKEVQPKKYINEKPVEFQEPKNLVALNLENFQTASLENFVKAIKHLIGKYGYYDVIFNIEKSSLYKVYISTGLELMTQQETFETFDPGQTIDLFLNREDFEKFTDLLRMIASS